jgi:hypothetical protein
MNISESSLWKKINLIQKTSKNWHLTRIESSTINGIPDIFGIVNGHPFWLELKANNAKNLNLTKFQINWHMKYQSCGGVVRILNALPSKTELQLLEIREDRSVSRVSCYNAQKTFDENLRVMLQEASRQDLVGRI